MNQLKVAFNELIEFFSQISKPQDSLGASQSGSVLEVGFTRRARLTAK